MTERKMYSVLHEIGYYNEVEEDTKEEERYGRELILRQLALQSIPLRAPRSSLCTKGTSPHPKARQTGTS
jgi:hypothetical protein